MRTLGREGPGQKLAVTDLVRIQAHGIGGMARSLVRSAQSEERAGTVLVRSVVAGSRRENRVGQAQHKLVIAAVIRGADLVERRHDRARQLAPSPLFQSIPGHAFPR